MVCENGNLLNKIPTVYHHTISLCVLESGMGPQYHYYMYLAGSKY